MKYDEFKSILWMQGIDSEIVESCRDFVVKEHEYIVRPKSRNRNVQDDIGYAELSRFTNIADCIKEIKTSIKMSTIDYDALGRSREKVLLKRLKKDPGKYIKRVMLKAFYLEGGTV